MLRIFFFGNTHALTLACARWRSGLDFNETAEEKEARLTLIKHKEEMRKALLDWRSDFEAKHGVPPTREDLAADVSAFELFTQFSKLNRA